MGGGLFSISLLAISSLKLPLLALLIISFAIKYRPNRLFLESCIELYIEVKIYFFVFSLCMKCILSRGIF